MDGTGTSRGRRDRGGGFHSPRRFEAPVEGIEEGREEGEEEGSRELKELNGATKVDLW